MVNCMSNAAEGTLNGIHGECFVWVVRVWWPVPSPPWSHALHHSLIRHWLIIFPVFILCPLPFSPPWLAYNANLVLEDGACSTCHLFIISRLRAHTFFLCLCVRVIKVRVTSFSPKPRGEKCCNSSFNRATQMQNDPWNMPLKCQRGWLTVKWSIIVNLPLYSWSFQFTAVPECFNFQSQWEIASLVFQI